MHTVRFKANAQVLGEYAVELNDEDTVALRQCQTEEEAYAMLTRMIDLGQARILGEETFQYVTMNIDGTEHVI